MASVDVVFLLGGIVVEKSFPFLVYIVCLLWRLAADASEVC